MTLPWPSAESYQGKKPRFRKLSVQTGLGVPGEAFGRDGEAWGGLVRFWKIPKDKVKCRPAACASWWPSRGRTRPKRGEPRARIGAPRPADSCRASCRASVARATQRCRGCEASGGERPRMGSPRARSTFGSGLEARSQNWCLANGRAHGAGDDAITGVTST